MNPHATAAAVRERQIEHCEQTILRETIYLYRFGHSEEEHTMYVDRIRAAVSRLGELQS